jgi:hypothetical protein
LERVKPITVAAIFPDTIGRKILGQEVLILLVLAMDRRAGRGLKSNAMLWTIDFDITLTRHLCVVNGMVL